jgi:dienelactone hydrolase
MNIHQIYILTALMLWGCHGNPKASSADNSGQSAVDTLKHSHTDLKPLDKGIVIDSVHCSDMPAQVYAVYLPSNYSSAKKWPIIYFFDPHGAGNLPLNLYKSLAEKYGYIIAGTYGSKNGMSMDASGAAADAFMKDTRQRLSIDNARLYTFGFSGGARVACSLALGGGITGVVACGGGFPQNQAQINQPFSLISFVGERDFNYIELKELDKQLDNSALTHQLIVFHGKHQWPPLSDIEQAFQWMDVNAMRAKTMPVNDSIVKSVQQEFLKELDKKVSQDKEIHEYFVYKKMLNFLRGLANTDTYTAKLDVIQKSDKLAKYLKDDYTDELEEARIQKEYLDDLSNKNAAWWQDKIKEMRGIIAKDSTLPVATQCQRLLSFLSLEMYMGASHSFNSTDDAATAYFLELYTLVDPTNPEHSYLFASMYGRENNPDKALSSLRDAVRLGFNDLRRMQADPNFSALKDKPEYKELVKKIEGMPVKIDVTQ